MTSDLLINPKYWRDRAKEIQAIDDQDDYIILDGDKPVGRIYREHGEARWLWSVNTSPFPAPPPNNGITSSLEEAKQQFKQRYEEMKASAAYELQLGVFRRAMDGV